MSAKRRVTSSDVAREAGVSRTTVSFVLNDKPNQSLPESTRQAVLDAAARLGYTPSAAARSLRMGRSGIVLCLFDEGAVNLEVSLFLSTLSSRLAADGLSCLTHNLGHNERPLSELWKAITPDAVIAFTDLPASEVAAIRRTSTALIRSNLDSAPGRPKTSLISQADVGRAQAEYLISRGHKRLGYAMPVTPVDLPLAERRLGGVAAACKAHRLAAPAIESVATDEPSGRLAVSNWRERARAINGVCAYSDDVAFAVLAGTRSLGLRVPEDIAVIGVDDVPLSALAAPPLTTIAFNVEAEACFLADSVLRAVGQDVQRHSHKSPVFSVVERESA